MSDVKIIRVSYQCESDKCIAVTVDIKLDEKGYFVSGQGQEWFPKSLCKLTEIPPDNPKTQLPKQYLTVPVWLLEKKNLMSVIIEEKF